MKSIVLLSLLFAFSVSATLTAQIRSSDDWNIERLERERKAMKTLFIWGSINLATGVAGSQITADEDEFKYASLMNAGFGAVNTTLGLLGLNRTKKQLKSLPSLEQGYTDLRKTRNILLVNAGLDVGYIVTGIILRDNSLVIGGQFYNPEIEIARKRGLGGSLIVQGAALLIFDSITAWQLSKSEIHISPVFTPNGAGIGFQSNLEREKPVGVAWF